MSSAAGGTKKNAFTGSSVAENYAKFLAPFFLEPWADILLERIPVDAGNEVADIACGTGVVTRKAAVKAGSGGRAVGCDVSTAMLEQARQATAPLDAAPIEYFLSPAESLPFADGQFDVVLCQQGLQFFEERTVACSEMRRILRAGGVVGIAVWAKDHRRDPVSTYAEAIRERNIPPPYPGAFDDSKVTLSENEVAEILAGAGFSAIETGIKDLTLTWPSRDTVVSAIFGTPYGPLVSELPEEEREGLLSDLAAKFGESAEAPVTLATSAVLAKASA
jgi:SAM-dependent methyltransferase